MVSKTELDEILTILRERHKRWKRRTDQSGQLLAAGYKDCLDTLLAELEEVRKSHSLQ